MNIQEKRFLMKNSLGEVREIYFDNQRIICKGIGDNQAQSVIISDVCGDFFAVLDSQDNVHILCQNTNGDIIYLNRPGDSWESETVLVSKTQEVYNKHFFMLPCGSSLHLFFIIKNEGKWMLIHQIKEETFKEPLVVDYINLSSNPFSIDKDNSENIYAFYNLEVDNYLQIGYKKFDASSGKWSQYSFITKSPNNNSTPQILSDAFENIHLTWLRSDGSNINIMYQKVNLPCEPKKLLKEILIGRLNEKYHAPSLFMVDENIYISWIDRSSIFACFSNDLGNSWNNPMVYSYHVHNIQRIIYFTNLHDEKRRLILKYGMNSSENPLKLYIVSDLLDVRKEYLEESAMSAENFAIGGSAALYLENIKSFFTKLSDHINHSEKEKSEYKREGEKLKKANASLAAETFSLRQSLEEYDTENKKLILECENLKKKTNNLNQLLSNKEDELTENLKELAGLNSLANDLAAQVAVLNEELDTEKSKPLFKRIFKFFRKNK